jgi:hypothetical protein
LTVTDIATGWTENRSVPDKTGKCVLAALNDVARTMPFPIPGVDSDNGSEFINDDVFHWCQRRQITFTRARPGNKNDGCHVEQKNWTVVPTLVGYHRYDTAAELLLLNEIWQLQSKLSNYFHPQQKLISKVRTGAKVSKKHDEATTPFHRTIDHPTMTVERIVALTRTYSLINPAATQRQVQALTAQLITLTTTKAATTAQPPINKRARLREATNPPRAHLEMRQQATDRRVIHNAWLSARRWWVSDDCRYRETCRSREAAHESNLVCCSRGCAFCGRRDRCGGSALVQAERVGAWCG